MTDLIERLREIPVWMVRDMVPGWQEHGTAAYEAADEIAALRARVAAVERLYDKWVLNLEWLDGLRERSDLTEFGDGRHTYATEIVSDLRAILSKQDTEYSGWVEVVDEGESP